MTELSALGPHALALLVWGLAASGVMATALEGAQLAGVSRMSLPFLFGAAVTGDRRRAVILGYVLYLLGGWLFALLYALVLTSLGTRTALAGTLAGSLVGLVHGLFLVAVFLPLLPFVHPRLASGYDGGGALAQLEPPGPFGLNYGRATPVVTVAAQALFGLVFGLGYGVSV